MLRRVGFVVFALFLLAVATAATVLGSAHRGIRREAAPLPSIDAVMASAQTPDRPLRAMWIDTASQAMPRAAVLDAARDPDPSAPYVMSHSSFVFEWSDGRILLVDVGMDEDGARRFGRPLEWLGGARPVEPLGSLARQLGDALPRVAGLVFTHLHADHVGGVSEFCRAHGAALPVFMTTAQDERPNYTTRPGRELLSTVPCVHLERLDAIPLAPVPGFSGVFVVAAGGHTPGSQVVVVHVAGVDGDRTYVVTGDIVNHRAGIDSDVPKPPLYRALVVPENEERQRDMRHFLRALAERGATLLVSHDRLDLERSPIARR